MRRVEIGAGHAVTERATSVAVDIPGTLELVDQQAVFDSGQLALDLASLHEQWRRPPGSR